MQVSAAWWPSACGRNPRAAKPGRPPADRRRFESRSVSAPRAPRSHRGVEAEHNWMATSGAADGRFLHGSAATHPRSFWTRRPQIRPCDQTAEDASINGKYSAAAAAARPTRQSAAERIPGSVGPGRHRPRTAAKRGSCDELLGFRADGRNRSTVVGGAGPAARILNPSPNATNGAIRATRREAGATGFDCGAGGAAGTGAVAL